MTADQAFIDIKEIAAKLLRISFDEINKMANPESLLKDDLGIDSVESLDLLHALESKYEIEIGDEEAARLKKVSDVIGLILKKKN